MLSHRRAIQALPSASTLALPACMLSLLLALLALAPLANAAAPVTVTVRVEGASRTLLPATTVTTNTTPVVKDGDPEHSCSGASAAGALELATGGNWSGTWFEGIGYSAETILGESHLFEPGAPANYYWGFWLDNKAASAGICEGELSSGDSILFFPECFGEACPAPPNPLAIEAPTVAERGAPITVSVTQYANASGEASPAAGVTVAGGGASATTNASGKATLSLAQTGEVELQAGAPGTVRDEATVCVHAGNDGNCGTTAAPGSSTTTVVVVTRPAPYTGPYALVARATGVLDGHVYPRARAPRVLRGTVTGHSPIASVSLRLRRSYRGRCWSYDGTSERFVRNRCGLGSFFKVSSAASFSYLLPGALAPGRYVLDLEATDTAGNRTSLARGSSRVVFYVR